MRETTNIVIELIRTERLRQDVLYPHFADTLAEMSLILAIETGELNRALGKLTWTCHRDRLDSTAGIRDNAIEEAVQVAAVCARIAEHLLAATDRPTTDPTEGQG